MRVAENGALLLGRTRASSRKYAPGPHFPIAFGLPLIVSIAELCIRSFAEMVHFRVAGIWVVPRVHPLKVLVIIFKSDFHSECRRSSPRLMCLSCRNEYVRWADSPQESSLAVIQVEPESSSNGPMMTSNHGTLLYTLRNVLRPCIMP